MALSQNPWVRSTDVKPGSQRVDTQWPRAGQANSRHVLVKFGRSRATFRYGFPQNVKNQPLPAHRFFQRHGKTKEAILLQGGLPGESLPRPHGPVDAGLEPKRRLFWRKSGFWAVSGSSGSSRVAGTATNVEVWREVDLERLLETLGKSGRFAGFVFRCF